MNDFREQVEINFFTHKNGGKHLFANACKKIALKTIRDNLDSKLINQAMIDDNITGIKSFEIFKKIILY